MAVSITLPDEVPDGAPMAVPVRSSRERPAVSWRAFRPRYVTSASPCNLDCPAGTDVRRFLALAASGDAAGAWRAILEHNPLPAVCGRVCYHPCEAACNRAGLDDKVAVHVIERAIAAEAARLGVLAEIADTAAAPAGARVAIVGSGPAGLSCAYHLVRSGHRPVIFESASEPGGMLRYGIPAYRLPHDVLAAEIGLLTRLGVEIRTSQAAGAAVSWSELGEYDAVFLGVGNQRPKSAGIPGETLDGVRPAIEFLRDVNAGRHVSVSGRVVVIGGGTTAIDAARVALRKGAKVTIIYRRSRQDMTAHPDEIAHAEAEGVQFAYQASPLRLQGWRGVLTSVHCQRTRPGVPEESGRRAPDAVQGDTFTLSCNDAFIATGEELETEAFEAVVDIVQGRMRADRWGRTAKAAIFAGGEAATGAGTVADAIGSGRRAAVAMHAMFSGVEVAAADPGARVAPGDLNLFYFGQVPRVHVPMLHKSYATAGFREVAGPLAWSEAVIEAGRCLSCGLCTECGNCEVFCPDAAVSHRPDGGYAIDESRCKGCGICVAECPRGAMSHIPEEAR
jgi:NADPH-dependent glutamate synthase beta subunit-like oxidoreductase